MKYKDMEAQLKYRTITYDKFLRGLERFIMGLSKKVLIADILGQTSSSIFYSMGMGMDAGTAWIALISYSFSLYMDFSGYSDMAIGMAAMMGFEFKENFNFPYLSTSITEFWRRWHMSLGGMVPGVPLFPFGRQQKRKCIPESVCGFSGNWNLARCSLGLPLLGSHARCLCSCGTIHYEKKLV